MKGLAFVLWTVAMLNTGAAWYAWADLVERDVRQGAVLLSVALALAACAVFWLHHDERT